MEARFDATTAIVGAEFGEPNEKNTVPVGASGDSDAGEGDGEEGGEPGSTGVVESWHYEGVRFDFFVDPGQIRTQDAEA